jgi:hypothetical protein
MLTHTRIITRLAGMLAALAAIEDPACRLGKSHGTPKLFRIMARLGVTVG